MMNRNAALLLGFFLAFNSLYADDNIPFVFGSSSKELGSGVRDISNDQSWEETSFELLNPKPVFGVKASSIVLSFYNDRLFSVKYELPANAFDIIRIELDKRYENPWSFDSVSSGRNAYWGPTDKMISMSEMGSYVLLTFDDASQKEFHWSDLMRGSLFWVLISIAGLFVLYFILAKLLTSYCEKCKSLGMRYEGVRYENYTDYARNSGFQLLQRSEIHPDTIYIYRCKKCKHIRNDRYSGFWKWWSNKS